MVVISWFRYRFVHGLLAVVKYIITQKRPSIEILE